jgi:hypothetical protein
LLRAAGGHAVDFVVAVAVGYDEYPLTIGHPALSSTLMARYQVRSLRPRGTCFMRRVTLNCDVKQFSAIPPGIERKRSHKVASSTTGCWDLIHAGTRHRLLIGRAS